MATEVAAFSVFDFRKPRISDGVGDASPCDRLIWRAASGYFYFALQE